jgi:hypothetical protein
MVSIGGDVLAELDKLLLGVGGNLTASGEALPGGTALPEAQQQEQDLVFLNDLAGLVVLMTAGRADEDEYLLRVAATQALFHEAQKQWYDAGNTSVGDGLRAWLKVPAATGCASDQLLVELSNVLTRTTCTDYIAALATAWDMPADLLERFQGEDVDETEQQKELELAGVGVPLALLNQAKAAYDLAKDIISPNTSEQGNLVHACIQMHYLTKHAGQRVLFDRYVGTHGLPPSAFTSLAAADGDTAALIRAALPALTGMGFKQPDILNLDTRQTYEIKPYAQWRQGANQLFGRYLLPLNTTAFDAATAAQLLNSVTTGGGYTAPISLTDPFLPGMWEPAPYYLLPRGEVAVVELACPGLILYQSANVKLPPGTVDVQSYEELSRQVLASVGALVVVAILGALAAPAIPSLLAAAAGFEVLEIIAALFAIKRMQPSM